MNNELAVKHGNTVRDENQKLIQREQRVLLHSGPLPHPNILRGYADIIPDAPERILRMTEEQSKHRIEMEASVVRSNLFLEKLGVLSGFVLALMGIGCGTWIILAGYSGWGFAAIVAALLPAGISYFFEQYQKYMSEKKSEGEGSSSSGK